MGTISLSELVAESKGFDNVDSISGACDCDRFSAVIKKELLLMKLTDGVTLVYMSIDCLYNTQTEELFIIDSIFDYFSKQCRHETTSP